MRFHPQAPPLTTVLCHGERANRQRDCESVDAYRWHLVEEFDGPVGSGVERFDRFGGHGAQVQSRVASARRDDVRRLGFEAPRCQ